MKKRPELYFKDDSEWRDWLHENHDKSDGVNLIFYKVDDPRPSMRWEDAVKVALCYGWIDSTVKSLGDGKRRQYFCPRNPKSVWSALNKKYLKELSKEGLIHQSGLQVIKDAKKNGSFYELDDVEKGIIPSDLQKAFDKNKKAFDNYKDLSFTYRKSYLYWLNQAKREATRAKRIKEIVSLCADNKKSRYH